MPLSAQTATVSDTFQLGTRQVRVPPPEGFLDAATKFDRVVQRFATAEDPGLETMASYVPDSMVSKLSENQNIEIPLFAKFSVIRRVKAVDVLPKDFAEAVKGVKEASSDFVNPNSKLTKDTTSNMNKSLEELWGRNLDAQISGQKNLGYFQDSDELFSFLVAMNLQIDGKTTAALCTGSLLRVNQRLIVFYVYKLRATKEDIDPVIELTKKWTAAVVAANK